MPLCSHHTIAIVAMSLLSPSSLPQLPCHRCCHCIITEALPQPSYNRSCHLIVTSHRFCHPSHITTVTMPSLSPSQSRRHAIVVACCRSCRAIILSSTSLSAHFSMLPPCHRHTMDSLLSSSPSFHQSHRCVVVLRCPHSRQLRCVTVAVALSLSPLLPSQRHCHHCRRCHRHCCVVAVASA